MLAAQPPAGGGGGPNGEEGGGAAPAALHATVSGSPSSSCVMPQLPSVHGPTEPTVEQADSSALLYLTPAACGSAAGSAGRQPAGRLWQIAGNSQQVAGNTAQLPASCRRELPGVSTPAAGIFRGVKT